jgi:hypothetical protein
VAVIDPQVEVEFTAGVWTDVSADVDLSAGINIRYGRTSEFSDPSTATCDLQLANHLGRYTPFSQLLADGVTVHPYYPNVVPRKRVRVAFTDMVPTLLRTNLCTNPSFETNTAGWSGGPSAWNNASSIAQSTAWSTVGVASLAVTTPGSATLEGCNFFVMSVAASTTYTVSADVRAVSGRPITMHLRDGTNAINAASVAVSAGTTQRVSATITTGASAPALGLLIAFSTDSTVGASAFNVDAVMVEQSATVGTYFDGSTASSGGNTYAWTGAANASTSTQTGLVPGTKYVRFFGYISAWLPSLENGTRAYVLISAIDRQGQESKFTAQPAHIATILSDGPFALWPNTDPAGVTTSYDMVNSLPLTVWPGSNTTFGVSNPAPVNEGTTALGSTYNGVSDSRSNIFNAPLPSVPAAASTHWSVEFWGGLNFTTSSPISFVGLSVVNTAQTVGFALTDNKDSGAASGTCNYVNGANSIALTFHSTPRDHTPHHYVLTGEDTGVNLFLKLYIDGALVASGTGATGDGGLTSASLVVSGGTTGDSNVTNTYGPIALHSTTLSVARILMHARIGLGVPSIQAGVRAAEYYSWQGVPAAEITADAGVATVASHPTAGKTLPTLLSEMATTEGGGAVAYHLPNGNARFCDRNFRKPGVPLATLDVQKDIVGAPFAPSVDDLNLITTSTVTRNGAGQFTYTDAVSQAVNGLTGDTATTFVDNDQDATNLAAARVVGHSRPGLRLPQFAVDLVTAETAGLTAALAGVQIGSRLRLTGVPVGVASSSTLDVIVEGWSLSITKGQWLYVFDATAADIPRRAVWSSFLWGCDSMTLTSTVTATATSISVTTAAGKPTFSTSAGSYPLAIKIGEEEMTITAAPASSVSPQALTVTRGTSGTKAAPQTAAAAVTLSPVATWSI